VYACDNDVVDHQVVALEFAGGATATFTMTAFSQAAGRATRLFGTRGELTGDGQAIRLYDFLTGARRLITPSPEGAMNAAEGHAGGDAGLMDAFTGAVATGNRELIRSGPRESLASHLAVFAAERARLNGTVETIPSHAAPSNALSRTDRGYSLLGRVSFAIGTLNSRRAPYPAGGSAGAIGSIRLGGWVACGPAAFSRARWSANFR
jgi:hypothetical protein